MIVVVTGPVVSIWVRAVNKPLPSVYDCDFLNVSLIPVAAPLESTAIPALAASTDPAGPLVARVGSGALLWARAPPVMEATIIAAGNQKRFMREPSRRTTPAGMKSAPGA